MVCHCCMYNKYIVTHKSIITLLTDYLLFSKKKAKVERQQVGPDSRSLVTNQATVNNEWCRATAANVTSSGGGIQQDMRGTSARCV